MEGSVASPPETRTAARGLPQVDPEVVELVDRHVERHGRGREQLIPLLHQVQERVGYLPPEIQELVADRLGLSPVEVRGVVTFYHFFTEVPRGRYRLKVCTGTACFVKRSFRLIDTIHDTIGIGVGEVSPDLLFSLEEVRCLGACGMAPAMMVNNEVKGNLTPQRVRNLLRTLRQSAGDERGTT